MCSLFCYDKKGCYSYSFENGICSLGTFHGPPEEQSASANKTCYVDPKGLGLVTIRLSKRKSVCDCLLLSLIMV